MNNHHSKAHSKLEKFYKDLLLSNPEFFEGILKKKPRSHSPQKKNLDNSEKSTQRKIFNQGLTINKQASMSSIHHNPNAKNKMGSLCSNTIRIKKQIKCSSTEKDFRKRFQLMLNSPVDNYYFNKRQRSLSSDKKHTLTKGQIIGYHKYNSLSTPMRWKKNKRDGHLYNRSKTNLSSYFNMTNNSNTNPNAGTSPKSIKKKNHKGKMKDIVIKTTANNVIKKNKINNANTNTNVNNKKQRENIKTGTNLPLIWKSILKMNNKQQSQAQANNSSKKIINKKKGQDDDNRAKNSDLNCLLTGKKIQDLIPSILNSKPTVNKNIFKIYILSRAGYGGPGDVKVNQDNYFIFKHLNDEPNTYFIGVCDGHGLTGQDISKYLITHLPKKVHNELKATNKYISNKEARNKAIKEAFIKTNEQLCQTQLIDTKYSGSTCVTIILKKSKIISANIGDSRAVLGRFILETNTWQAIDLTRDHKPSDIGESERILAHGGRIESYTDEYGKPFGPLRIWLKNEEVPGLAMSRSFGDKVASGVGTISIPEIKEYKLTTQDKFVIVASDGIWEYINSTECVNFVKDYYLKNDPSGCLSFLWNESSKRWINEEERIDDITCILIFFENND